MPVPATVPSTSRTSWYASMRAAFDRDGRPADRAAAQLPQRRSRTARGLGSSSAAIVGGVALARALVAGGVAADRRRELFGLAAEIEGHPDNVAPAFYGGFVISGRDGRLVLRRPRRRRPAGQRVVFVPPYPVSTRWPAGCCPAEVPHADAAANAGRTALLVAALAGQPEQLLRAPPATTCTRSTGEPAMPDIPGLVRDAAGRRGPGDRLRRRADGAGVHRRARARAADGRTCWPGARTAGTAARTSAIDRAACVRALTLRPDATLGPRLGVTWRSATISALAPADSAAGAAPPRSRAVRHAERAVAEGAVTRSRRHSRAGRH